MNQPEQMEFAEFLERFSPDCYPGTATPIPRDWPRDEGLLDLAVGENRCWTVRWAEEGGSEIVNGHDTEERNYSLITARPYEEDKTYIIKDTEWGAD